MWHYQFIHKGPQNEAMDFFPTVYGTYIALETMTVVLIEAPTLSSATAEVLLEHDAVAVGKLVWFLPWMLPSLRFALLDAEKRYRETTELAESVKSRLDEFFAPRKGAN